MSAYPSPSREELEKDPDPDPSDREEFRRRCRIAEKEYESDKVGNGHGEGNDKRNNASQVSHAVAEEDDNGSICSWEKEADDTDISSTTKAPSARPLGLSRRTGYTKYDDFDVVTVHGARDDHETVWTARHDNSNWILDNLFSGLRVRQLDYIYDTGDAARIYSPCGITTEANALLDSLAENRAELPDTECDRPIIWICHDLGGNIVKQALSNSMYRQPDPDYEDYPEDAMAIRKIYRRLPILTSSIIFLGCPHTCKSNEDLEDELLTLISLPGPPVKTQVLQKIRTLSRQIERTNLEFLESKVLDRAVVINIISGPEQQVMTNAAQESQTEPHSMEEEEKRTNRNKPDFPFSTYTCRMFHNLGMFYTLHLETTDHLGLVRGPDLSAPFNWTGHISSLFKVRSGFTIENNPSIITYQNSLLSLSPPTRVRTYMHQSYTESATKPNLTEWIMEHDVFFQKGEHQNLGPKTVYIHAGSRGHVIDIKLASQQLCFAYDSRKKNQNPAVPCYGCFYFEFDRHDCRRGGIKAMITYFLCTFACRFWTGEHSMIRWSSQHLNRFRSWSLQDLIVVFLRVRETYDVKNMTIILAQIDHCDEQERMIFLEALLGKQSISDSTSHFIITTSRSDNFICGILPPNSVISLDDCPLSLDEYLLYPDHPGASEDTTKTLLAGRPKSAHLGPKLNRMFKKFRKSSSLQIQALELPSSLNLGAPTHRASGIVQEVSSGTHQRQLQRLIAQLTEQTQRIMRHAYNWVKYAAEPLTPEILTEAITWSLPEEMAQLGRPQGDEDFAEFVQDTMRGIISRDGRDIRFSDDVFYDVSVTGKPHDEQKQTHRSHADMATACLRYLLGTEGQTMLHSLSVESHGMDEDDWFWSPIMLPRHSLVSYALRFWTVHYQAAGAYRPVDLATELFEDSRKRGAWTEALYVISNPFTRIHRDYISPLPYMAMFGLDDLIRRQIDNEERQDYLYEDHWLAIIEAARNGHRNTVTLLLKHTDTGFGFLAEAIDWAASYGEGGALDCLVSEAQQIESFRWPRFILDRAVAAGLDNLVSALVQTGHDLYERDSYNQDHATHSAVVYNQNRALEILLNVGCVDVELRNIAGESALELAIKIGSPQSAQCLLDAGASVDNLEDMGKLLNSAISWANHQGVRIMTDSAIFDDDQINSALSHAAMLGHKECTRLLLDKGADPNGSPPSRSALYEAIAGGPFPEICRMLLEKGANPNQPVVDDLAHLGLFKHSKAKPTLLTVAIMARSMSVASMLLDYGATINPTEADANESPLSAAMVFGQRDIVDLLLERGADPNLGGGDLSFNGPPLMISCLFMPEASLIDSLIKHGVNVRCTMARNGWSALHAAHCNSHLLPMLLTNGVDINVTDDVNCTVLLLAAKFGEIETVEVLLKQTNPKADLEVMVTREPTDTALHISCQYGQGDIVSLLLEAGADINRQRSDGKFPLGLLLASDMSSAKCEDIITLMLKRRPNMDLADNEANTALHNVKSDTPLSVVMRLVEEGAPVHTINELGYSPLAWAVKCGNTKVARYLTTVKGVQSAVYHPTFGSILHMAAASSTLEVVRQLVRTGAEHSIVDPVFGESVLYCAIGNENRQECRRITRYLVEEVDVDIDAPGGEWVCPLLRVVAENRESDSLLKYLLRHEARTDQADTLGLTVVHWAVLHERIDRLEMLLNFGAGSSVADNYGRTPLHFAAGMNNLPIVQRLLRNPPTGVDVSNVNVADMDGWTPLMWACRTTGDDVARLLVEDYNVPVAVRSKDAEWSPLKIAHLHGWLDELTEFLIPDTESRDSDKTRKTEPGDNSNQTCVGCKMMCVGQIWSCTECTAHLCFKCIQHSAKMHDPNHRFTEWAVQRTGEEGSLDGAEEHEHVLEIGDESDEEDSESEEEEDDDSE